MKFIKESNMKKTIVLIFLTGAALLSEVNAQTNYNEETLSVKRMFAIAEITALADNFVGIVSEKGTKKGLYTVKSTGVSNQPIIAAAVEYLGALSPEQKIKTQFAVDDPEWRKWSNVDNGIYVRQGISFEEMSAEQKKLAWQLLQESLSAKGIELSKNIMKTDQTLKELNDDELSYGEEKYFITIMGIPSKTEPWGWQLDGHHLVINYFVLGDQVVVTPMFLGAEPVTTTSGKYIGNSVLQDEQNLGLELLQSLDDEQQREAILEKIKNPVDLRAQAGKDNLLMEYSGISAKNFSSTQKKQLTELISLFVNNMRDEHARVRLGVIVHQLT